LTDGAHLALAFGGCVLPDLSVLWVIFFLLVLTIVLDRLLFRPIQRVIQQREEAVRSARELAERSAREAAAALAEFEKRTSAARAEVYREMDEVRRSCPRRAPKRNNRLLRPPLSWPRTLRRRNDA
jgi:hypothetical protein